MSEIVFTEQQEQDFLQAQKIKNRREARQAGAQALRNLEIGCLSEAEGSGRQLVQAIRFLLRDSDTAEVELRGEPPHGIDLYFGGVGGNCTSWKAPCGAVLRRDDDGAFILEDRRSMRSVRLSFHHGFVRKIVEPKTRAVVPRQERTVGAKVG
jgi:hypothetical protein